MKKFFSFTYIILAYVFLVCYHILYNDTSFITSSHNIFNLPLYIFVFSILSKGWKVYPNMKKNKWIFPVLGFVYSIFLVFGKSIDTHNAVPLTSPFIWLSAFVFSLVITAAILCFYQYFLPKLHFYCNTKEYPILKHLFNKIGFFHFWIGIILCWFPIFLACYPGIASYDTNYQLSQVNESLHLTSHHPIIHTLLLGGLVEFGRNIFLSANIGMCLYTCIQMLINSCIFAYCLNTIKKLFLSPLPCALSFMFFAFMPFNSIFAICSTKDSIFSSLFLLFIVRLSKQVIDRTKAIFNKKDIIILVIILFLLSILRNNMVYAIILSIPFMLIFYPKCRKQILCICLLPILLLELYKGILYPTLNVTPGNSREAFSVIMQQYANVYNNCEINKNDQTMLLKIMDDTSWKKYEPRKSDSIKDHFNTQIFTDNLSDYLSLWIKLGFEHPACYLNAFLNLTYAYWYPNDILPDETTYRKYIEVYDSADISFDSKLPGLFSVIENIGMNASYQNYPVISIFFTPAFYIWILLFLVCCCLYKQNYNFIKILIIPFTLFLTLLLGPVALLRYLYPIIICVPYFICMSIITD